MDLELMLDKHENSTNQSDILHRWNLYWQDSGSNCASMFKKLSLELGGKNATIILDDANLSTAAVRQGPHLSIQPSMLCGSF